MGMDALDIKFRLEKQFEIAIDGEDFAGLVNHSRLAPMDPGCVEVVTDSMGTPLLTENERIHRAAMSGQLTIVCRLNEVSEAIDVG